MGCRPGGYKESDMTEHTHDMHIESKAVINRRCGRGMKSCLMGTEFLFRIIKVLEMNSRMVTQHSECT